MNVAKLRALVTQVAARGGVILFFIIALEVMIMISPFAFFFYSVFNPVFKWLDHYAATRWLTAFFLPHMILPPTLFLKSLRILGSALFIVGMATFVLCALQVYLGKIFKPGVATKGLYRFVRHPQYLALGIWGVGMSVLWPRFIVLASLSIMFILYSFLARDEEARMRLLYGEAYEQYARNTGRFFPQTVERGFAFIGRVMPKPLAGGVLIPLQIICVVIGTGFVCRAVTLSLLPFESKGNVTLLPILPEDQTLSANVLSGISRSAVNGKMGYLDEGKDYLGYLMPADYIMQGMIADTGGDTHLFKQHQTFAMITDWVLHPFEHLRRSPSMHMAKAHGVDPDVARRHHCPLGINDENLDCKSCPYRRVIVLEVERPPEKHVSGSKLLSLDSVRVPIEVIDLNAQTGEIVQITKLGRSTAWKDVPTPAM